MHSVALCSLPSALVAGVCAAGILGACDVTIKDGDIKNVSVQRQGDQEWNRHYPLADGGRVEIVNANGPIEVSSGPAGAVDVAAVIEAQGHDRGARERDSERGQDRGVRDARSRSRAPRFARRGRGGLEVSYKVTRASRMRGSR